MNPANKKEGRNERRCRQREGEDMRISVVHARAVAPCSRILSALLTRGASTTILSALSGVPRDSGRSRLPPRTALLTDRAAKCRALRRKSSQFEFFLHASVDPGMCRRTCVISPVDLMVRERYWSWSNRSIFRDRSRRRFFFFLSFLFIGVWRNLEDSKSRSVWDCFFLFFFLWKRSRVNTTRWNCIFYFECGRILNLEESWWVDGLVMVVGSVWVWVGFLFFFF